MTNRNTVTGLTRRLNPPPVQVARLGDYHCSRRQAATIGEMAETAVLWTRQTYNELSRMEQRTVRDATELFPNVMQSAHRRHMVLHRLTAIATALAAERGPFEVRCDNRRRICRGELRDDMMVGQYRARLRGADEALIYTVSALLAYCIPDLAFPFVSLPFHASDLTGAFNAKTNTLRSVLASLTNLMNHLPSGTVDGTISCTS